MSLGELARRLIPANKPVPAPTPLPVPETPLPLPPAPSLMLEGRVEFRSMLWHPVLGLREDSHLVVSAKAGLPHCARCDKALTLSQGSGDAWSCAACGEARPAADVDFFAMDCVIAEAMGSFFKEHPEFTPAPGLSVPARALQAAV